MGGGYREVGIQVHRGKQDTHAFLPDLVICLNILFYKCVSSSLALAESVGAAVLILSVGTTRGAQGLHSPVRSDIYQSPFASCALPTLALFLSLYRAKHFLSSWLLYILAHLPETCFFWLLSWLALSII